MNKNTLLIPVDADYYPRPAAFPEYIQAAVAGQKRIIANVNKLNSDSFQAACEGWRPGNLINREMGRPLTPKPAAQPTLIVHDVDVQFAGTPVEGEKTMQVVVSAGIDGAEPYAGTYMWIEVGPTPVCPDLPPAEAPVVIPDPVYAIGDVMNNPVGDRWPVGHIEIDPDNGNQYRKMSHQSPFSSTRVVYFYQRIK